MVQWNWNCHLLPNPNHTTYVAFTHRMINGWSYLSRTIPDIVPCLQSLEDIICISFIPALTGQPPLSDHKRNIFALPVRLRGLALADPTIRAANEYLAWVKITQPLTNSILEQNTSYSYEVIPGQLTAKTEVSLVRRRKSSEDAEELKLTLPSSLLRVMDLAQEKGASS